MAGPPRRRQTDEEEREDGAATPPAEKNETFFDESPDATPKSQTRSRDRSNSSRSLTGRRVSQSSAKTDKDRMPVSTPAVPEAAEDDDDARADETAASGNNAGVAAPAPNIKSSSDGEMDDVNLELGGDPSKPQHARTATATSTDPASPPPPPPRDPTPTRTGFSGTFQDQYPPPPPAPPKKDGLPEKAAAPTRKLTSPFAWLSRNTSGEKKSGSPTIGHERSDTKSSSITLGSVSTENANGDAEHKATLKDRFMLLRMQGEAGDDAKAKAETNGGSAPDTNGHTPVVGLGIGGASDQPGDSESSATDEAARPGMMPRRKTIDPKLPPGTVAGMSEAPPTESAAVVDWDLWQKLVDEGPAAVKATSEAELKTAIASGIPHTIRGVVWQVLADSKHDELERLYRELITRGSSPKDTNGSMKERETIASSASSVHSSQSTPTNASSPSERSTLELALPTVNGSTGVDEPIARMIHEVHTKPVDIAAIQKLEKTIKKDVGARTSYSKYVMAAGLQDGLFGVCKAYALLDDPCGYAQGMNFIAMPLLFNMPEEEAFTLLATLMTAPKYRLRTLFAADLAGLHLLLYQFARALEDLDPQLYCHLHRRGVEPSLYATQWFLTLFAYRFPLQLVLRVYDFVLSEGLEMAMVRFAVALVSKNREQLLAMREMDKLTGYLKEKLFDVYIDKSPSASSLLESGFFGSAGGADKEVYKADVLVADAVAVEITTAMLRSYEVEWSEQTRAEKERETELESLRSSTQTLGAKVRRLESQAQKNDTEHVEIASELVRTKVENESLRDENETLKGQVTELRKVVQTQTEEVERRLKGEIESVMQKNVEIFGENRRLEEELGEMEKVLVGVKMELAQLNGDHEGLRQRWNNIVGQMKPE